MRQVEQLLHDWRKTPRSIHTTIRGPRRLIEMSGAVVVSQPG